MSVMVAIGVLALTLVLIVLELVRRRRLKERFAAVWIALSVLVALGILFPRVVEAVAERLGFVLPANLVLVAGLVALIFVTLQLSVEVGRLRDGVERVSSRLAVLEADPSGEDHDPDLDEPR